MNLSEYPHSPVDKEEAERDAHVLLNGGPPHDWDDRHYCSDRCDRHWDDSGPDFRRAVVCPECERYVDPVGAATCDNGLVEVGLHFDTHVSGDYAMPAFSPEEVIHDNNGEVLYRVCPGSGKLGQVAGAETESAP